MTDLFIDKFLDLPEKLDKIFMCDRMYISLYINFFRKRRTTGHGKKRNIEDSSLYFTFLFISKLQR
ncbi:MAG TPA: hypothetical protein PLQ41_01775, partial [bacterium]|nr:hypothetical protein [bacterium]